MNWRTIDSAPTHKKAIVFAPMGGRRCDTIIVAIQNSSGAWFSRPGDYRIRPEPTHWMPLPDPPQSSDPPVAHTEQLSAMEENEG